MQNLHCRFFRLPKHITPIVFLVNLFSFCELRICLLICLLFFICFTAQRLFLAGGSGDKGADNVFTGRPGTY